jgi:uncharacterized cupredoxin-like copper-binding protein
MKFITAFAALAISATLAQAADAVQVVHVGLIDPSVIKGANITGGAMMKHDMMTLRADIDKVKAGKVQFEVFNFSHALVHEMLVLAVDDNSKPLPIDKATNKFDEKVATSLGEVPELAAGASGQITLDMKPGKYMLACNQPGHYNASMWVPITVE